MDESFKFHPRNFDNRLLNIVEAHLSCQVDPADPLLLPESGGAPVDGIGLGRKVQFPLRRHLPYRINHPRVGDNVGVEGERCDLRQVLFQLGK